MNLTVFASGDEVFKNCECIKGYTFKMVVTRGKSTHLTDTFAQLQDSCAHITVLNASRHLHTSCFKI